jgi:hypothetical protein
LIADELGYSSYAELAYKTQEYDYSPDEMKELLQSIGKYVSPVASDLDYIVFRNYFNNNPQPTLDEIELINKLYALYASLGGDYQDAYSYMLQHGLYDVSKNADNRFSKVFATTGTIQTSDEREKDILPEVQLTDYSDLFMDIIPIAYRWKSGKDPKIYFGVGAQTLKNLFYENGFDAESLGVIEYDELEEPTANGQTDRYGINYQNLQMLTLMQAQKNTREIESLKEFDLSGQVDSLKVQLEQALLEIELLKNTLKSFI